MAKFRKRPVVIEAIQFDGTPKGAVELFSQFDISGGKFEPDYDLKTGNLMIPTLEGKMRAHRNDWIIRGVKGEFYPIKNDIFRETYEEVDNAT